MSEYTKNGQWLDKTIEDLDKAKIIDMKSRKTLADLPSPDVGKRPRAVAEGKRIKPVAPKQPKVHEEDTSSDNTDASINPGLGGKYGKIHGGDPRKLAKRPLKSGGLDDKAVEGKKQRISGASSLRHEHENTAVEKHPFKKSIEMSERIMKTDENGHLVPLVKDNSIQAGIAGAGGGGNNPVNSGVAAGLGGAFGKGEIGKKIMNAVKEGFGAAGAAAAGANPASAIQKPVTVPKIIKKGEIAKGKYTAGGQWIDKVEKHGEEMREDNQARALKSEMPMTPQDEKSPKNDPDGKPYNPEDKKIDFGIVDTKKGSVKKGEEARNDNKGGQFLKREMLKFSPGNQWEMESVGPQAQSRKKK